MIAVQPRRREINLHLIARIEGVSLLNTSIVIGTQCVQTNTLQGLFANAGSPSEFF